MLIIQPIGGLCNRMRAINSARILAEKRGDFLIVLWFENAELNCPFEELFKSSPFFKVINFRKNWNIRKLWYRLTCQFISNMEIGAHKSEGVLFPDFEATLKKRCYIATEEHFFPCHEYDYFVPTKLLQNKINELIFSLGDYAVGVHIRRTDNLPAISKSSTDAFIKCMEDELKINPATVFYIATDDSSEEARLREYFRGHIASNECRDLSRNTAAGIKDALLDLYCLASTNKIIGSYYSSFTDIAADMRDIPKIIAGEQ